MKIQWGRVLNAALISEILLLMIYQIFIWKYGRGQTAMTLVVIGSFVFMLAGALWAARKIESRFILHGFLVGVIAALYYAITTFPRVLSGEYANYFQTALIGHTPKLLGGIAGGWIAAMRMKAAQRSAGITTGATATGRVSK